MIMGNWRLERQISDSNNKEVGDGMAKTDQPESNIKFGNSDQIQLKKCNLRSRKANDILVITNLMMVILNVMRQMNQTQIMYNIMKK